MSETIRDLLETGGENAPAIAAEGYADLGHGDLRNFADAMVAKLNALGIGRHDRVAIVLPNGPHMAAAFLTIACAATTAPLNPAYREDEFEFYLDDLNARALVVMQDYDGPALKVAEKRGITILRLIPDADTAGLFRLTGPSAGECRNPGVAGDTDIALVLHTSGTTSRPKIVPLSHSNLVASANHIRMSLSLVPSDRCLNIMPLFHIHGLVAAVLSSVGAGGSVWCSSGFNALKFFNWMELATPTWYTAVPTMHQAILTRAARNADTIADFPLRLIRSSSSSLPPQVMSALEEIFTCPVIESYGMTEAAHQMTSNPLPPADRKPGTVGVPAGPDVGIMDPDGRFLVRGKKGEIVIRGPNVTPGYEANPKANEENFINGWFRTGDQGVMDEEGYLTITGRLKEIINRGGEKISPREVDDVLMDHPSVQQVVTFARSHPKLGEDVAVAIVLAEGQAATDRDIRDFAARRMADFKVPRTVLFLDEIPKGATGKLQRIGLAAKLGLEGE